MILHRTFDSIIVGRDVNGARGILLHVHSTVTWAVIRRRAQMLLLVAEQIR